MLEAAIRDLAAFVRGAQRGGPAFVEKNAEKVGAVMLVTWMSHADALFDHLSNGPEDTMGHDEHQRRAKDQEQEDGNECFNFPGFASDEVFAIAPQLLRSVWYKFGHCRAQVCALVPHRTAKEKPGMPNLMISLQRLVLYVVSKLYDTSLASGAEISFAHVPHKRRLQQGPWVHDCWNEREARVMVAADVRAGTQSITHWLAYSHMACGLKWDPPHT